MVKVREARGQNRLGGKINQGLSLYKHTGAHVRTRTATQGGWPQIKWITMGKTVQFQLLGITP